MKVRVSAEVWYKAAKPIRTKAMTLFTEIFSGTCKIAPKIVMIELNEIQRKERIEKHLFGGV